MKSKYKQLSYIVGYIEILFRCIFRAHHRSRVGRVSGELLLRVRLIVIRALCMSRATIRALQCVKVVDALEIRNTAKQNNIRILSETATVLALNEQMLKS